MSLPPSSPRLPSPPPPAEIQITPKSPLMGPNAVRQASQMEQTAIDTNAKRRIHPGTKSSDMAAGPPLVPLHELDSAFQLQEHLSALHYYHTASRTTPVNRDTAKLLATPPPGIDRTLWLYELCRFLIAQCNSLIVGFLFDTPPCSAATCPEMRAGEWQFLCAVHDTPKSCCAIDYCCHTLDWAANVVTNPKIFPSRFVVDAHDKNTALKNLVNVFRRLHRIFAHAWFQHRGVFWTLENQSGLYVFFKTVCDVYDLLPAENYKLPPEAEGLDPSSGAGDAGDKGSDKRAQHPFGPITIARPPGQRDSDDGDFSGISRTNTRRHIKSSPSVGSAVTTVHEADEDESADLSHRLRGMRISSSRAPPEEEADLASIPVIVEHAPMPAAERPVRPSSVVPPPEPVRQEDEAPAGPSLPSQVVPDAPAPEPQPAAPAERDGHDSGDQPTTAGAAEPAAETEATQTETPAHPPTEATDTPSAEDSPPPPAEAQTASDETETKTEDTEARAADSTEDKTEEPAPQEETAEPKTETLVPEPGPEPGAEPEPEPESEPAAEAEAEPKTEPEAKADKPEPKQEPEVEPQLESAEQPAEAESPVDKPDADAGGPGKGDASPSPSGEQQDKAVGESEGVAEGGKVVTGKKDDDGDGGDKADAAKATEKTEED